MQSSLQQSFVFALRYYYHPGRLASTLRVMLTNSIVFYIIDLSFLCLVFDLSLL